MSGRLPFVVFELLGARETVEISGHCAPASRGNRDGTESSLTLLLEGNGFELLVPRGGTLRSRVPRPSPRALAYRLGGDSGLPSGALPFAWCSPKATPTSTCPSCPRRRAAVHAGGDRGQICLGRTVRRGRHRPALAPHLAKSDRDVDPGSGAVTDEYVAAFRTLWTEKKPAIDGRYVH